MKKKKLYYFDYSLLLILILLVAFGMVMLYSVSAYQGNLKYNDPAHFLKRQAAFAAVGFFFLLIESYYDYRRLRKFGGFFYALAMFLCIAVNFVGTNGNGSTRWFKVGPITIQPSEIAKAAVIIFLAALISRSNASLNDTKNIIKVFLILVPCLAAIAYNNLSTAVIVAGIAFIMLFIASRRTGVFAGILFVGLFGVVIFIMTAGYRSDRIAIWLHPENYDKGYQTMQALYAIGSGGLFGRGLGASMQKLGFVPEAQNDMIFSIICEELGIFGAVGLIILYILLLWRCVIVAMNAHDQFGSFLVIGVMPHISLQVLLNIAVVTNTIPNTGVTLPFISYGGSALIILLMEMGLVLSVSHRIPLGSEELEA